MYFLDDIVTFRGVECGVWVSLAKWNLGRGHSPQAVLNLVIISVKGSFSSAAIFPAGVRNFVVGILSGLQRHIPSKEQLLTGMLFICYWGPLTQALCAI